MRKKTVWLLIVFLGVSFSSLLAAGGQSVPMPKMLAQVGVMVGIAPNPYNTLNDQLQQKQDQLDKQAADLAAREAAFASSAGNTTTSSSNSDWHLDVAIAIVGFLVLLNFYLDWRRSRRESIAACAITPEENSHEGEEKIEDIAGLVKE